jgi:V8-like Glu-specific endopeptidase
LLAQLPNDYVVAISNDCQISDFKTQIHKLSKQYEDPKGHELIMLPSLPRSKNDIKVEPFRIIGTDDRTEISDTTVFPWTTVVKINGQFSDEVAFECTGRMLGPSSVVVLCLEDRYFRPGL